MQARRLVKTKQSNQSIRWSWPPTHRFHWMSMSRNFFNQFQFIHTVHVFQLHRQLNYFHVNRHKKMRALALTTTQFTFITLVLCASVRIRVQLARTLFHLLVQTRSSTTADNYQIIIAISDIRMERRIAEAAPVEWEKVYKEYSHQSK